MNEYDLGEEYYLYNGKQRPSVSQIFNGLIAEVNSEVRS
jgi:hypothetical protein